jgi:DNA-binding transcriptional ArsR family regulator
MWLLRAFFPIGAAANIYGVLAAGYFIGGRDVPPFTSSSFPTFAFYLLCLFITVKEALGLAILSVLLSSVYFLLTRFFPEYDFEWSGYAFTALVALPLVIHGAASERRGKASLKAYFLRRQIGSLDDLTAATSLSEATVQKHLKAFLKSGELIVMLDKPVLYKWTEERTYPEGMETVELSINI